MFKKLVQALSRIPGLGFLRRGDDTNAPRASEARGDVSSTPTSKDVAASERIAPTAARVGGSGATREPVESAPRRTGSPATEVPTATAAALAGAPRTAAAPASVASTSLTTAGTARASGTPAAPAERNSRAQATAPTIQRLGLAAIGPGRAFAFWKLSPKAIERAREFVGEGAGGSFTALTLRVRDLTDIDFDGSNARRTLDLVVDEVPSTPRDEADTIEGNQYLDLWPDDPEGADPERVYCEIGVKDAAGTFVTLAWSPVVDLPVIEESQPEPAVRAVVNGEHGAPWRPRREPLASATQGSEEAPATVRGEDVEVGLENENERGADAEPGQRQDVTTALKESTSWPFGTPSSADIARRDRRRGALGGVSSGLLVRRGS